MVHPIPPEVVAAPKTSSTAMAALQLLAQADFLEDIGEGHDPFHLLSGSVCMDDQRVETCVFGYNVVYGIRLVSVYCQIVGNMKIKSVLSCSADLNPLYIFTQRLNRFDDACGQPFLAFSDEEENLGIPYFLDVDIGYVFEINIDMFFHFLLPLLLLSCRPFRPKVSFYQQDCHNSAMVYIVYRAIVKVYAHANTSWITG